MSMESTVISIAVALALVIITRYMSKLQYELKLLKKDVAAFPTPEELARALVKVRVPTITPQSQVPGVGGNPGVYTPDFTATATAGPRKPLSKENSTYIG